MPGFILHLTAAQMLLRQLPHHPGFPYEISLVNDFLIGNLLPDTTLAAGPRWTEGILSTPCRL